MAMSICLIYSRSDVELGHDDDLPDAFHDELTTVEGESTKHSATLYLLRGAIGLTGLVVKAREIPVLGGVNDHV